MLTASFVFAAGFKTYENARFGYFIEMPSDFKIVSIPENGDGLAFESADGVAKLSVWGNYLTQGGFKDESDFRLKSQEDEGWKITYEKRGASWASFSGIKGGHIFYMREIALCDDAMGNFLLEYPADQQRRFGSLVQKLVTTLKAAAHCE
jgi:hypothetical protein